MRSIIFFLFLLVALSAAAPALADERYVSDQLLITLRQGEGEKYKILKMLKTGTPLEVLNEGDNYLLVRAQDGTEGYVLKQYISDETPKTVIIARLERENENLKKRLEDLKGSHSELTQEVKAMDDLTKELEAVQKKYHDLEEKSANVVQLAAERDELKKQNAQLAQEAGALRQKNEKLLYTGSIQWFLAGGGVLLFGWIMGKMSGSKKKRGFSY